MLHGHPICPHERNPFKLGVQGKFEQYRTVTKLILICAREHKASLFTWLGKAKQRQVNILAVLLVGDDEVKNLEVLAADDQRASSSRRGQFLQVAHQAVKNLEDIT